MNVMDLIVARYRNAWIESGTSVASAAHTISHAAVTGKKLVVTEYVTRIRGATATGDIRAIIYSGTTPLWRDCIGSGAARGDGCGLAGTVIVANQDEAINFVVDAGGADVILVSSIAGFWVDP
jgi:hypothetical protein